MAHPGGRPTKLTKELIERATKYLDDNDDLGPAALLPTVERLCLILEIDEDTFYDWRANRPEFSEIARRLRQSAADKLQQNGLANRWNASIATLLLSKHGYVRRTELTGKDGEQLMPTPILGGGSVKENTEG